MFKIKTCNEPYTTKWIYYDDDSIGEFNKMSMHYKDIVEFFK